MKITRRLGLRLASIVAAATSLVALGAAPALADPHTEVYKGDDGWCVSAGGRGGNNDAYMGNCNNQTAKWIPSGPYYDVRFASVGNGGCLDSNAAGKVYSIGCNGGGYQRWYMIWMPDNTHFAFRNNATNQCLTVDAGHNLYAAKCTWVPNSPWIWSFQLFS
jgi:hypothetical protein